MSRLLLLSLILIAQTTFAKEVKFECAPNAKPQIAEAQTCSANKDSVKDLSQSCKEIEDNLKTEELKKAMNELGMYNSNSVSKIDMLKQTIDWSKKSIEAAKKLEEIIKDFDSAKAKSELKYPGLFDKYTQLTKKGFAQLSPEEHQELANINMKSFESNHDLILTNKESYVQMMKFQPKIDQMKEQLDKSEKELAELEKNSATESKTESDLNKFKEFITVSAYDRRKMPNFVDCGFTDAEIVAIGIYTGSGYRRLNEILYSNKTQEKEKAKPFIDTLNSALSKIKNYEGSVKRGAHFTADILEKHCLDCIVEYQAFTSTSTGSGFGGNTKFTIKSKSGKYIAPLSFFSYENEVLFKSGTKFKILNKNQTGSATEITMEEVE